MREKKSTNDIIVSIIIATFNSEKTLPLVLHALEKQTYPQKKIEVLLVDGGSTDSTLMIAKKFHCIVINNPRTEPIHAKFLGYLNAKGKYLMYLDHDEVIENKNSLQQKLHVFSLNQHIKTVIGSGYKNPPNYPIINNYINEFGDPFSFFIYRLSKDAKFFIPTMKKRYPILVEDDKFILFDLSKIINLPILELVAGGSMFDREYFMKTFPETTREKELLPHFFYLLYAKLPYIAITKNDSLFHYSSDTFTKYFNKITWRIKNNIYHVNTMGLAGFSGRTKFESTFGRWKKYLFIFYAFSIIFPLCDAIYLVLSRKNILYIIHVPLCIYTAGLIVFHYSCKLMGNKPKLRSYDNTKEVG